MSKLILTEQGSTPTTPSSGKMAIYAKSDGKPYALNDSGVEYDLATSAGGGEDLATTLALGNLTDGSDIVLSAGDELAGESGVGVAGDIILRAGTDSSAAVDGGNIVLIPGQGTNAGHFILESADETHFVDVEVTGAETLSVGTTYRLEYDGTTGKLTVPGIIDPIAVIFEHATAPTTGSSEGAVFVSDGTGGLALGHLYFVPPSSGSPVDISNPTVAADTLQAAYNAGHTITLVDAVTPVEITAGALPSATTSLLAFKKSSGDGLASLKHTAPTRVRLEGATGGAGIDGTGIEIQGGAGGAGVAQDGGDVRFRPGAKTGTGKDGQFVFSDAAGSQEVALLFDSAAHYPGTSVLRSPTSGGGSLGAMLGPVVQVMQPHVFSSAGEHWTIPNHAGCVLITSTYANCVLYLPAFPVLGQSVVVKDITASGRASFTVTPSGGATIDGAASKPVGPAPYLSYTFLWDGISWFII